jgi:hypothetical protein
MVVNAARRVAIRRAEYDEDNDETMMIAVAELRRRRPAANRPTTVDGRKNRPTTLWPVLVKHNGEGQSRAQIKATLLTAVSAITLVVLMSGAALKPAMVDARYIQSTYRFSPNNLVNHHQLDAINGAVPQHQPRLSRRQDYDGSEADGDDDDEDQNVAASYRNQDDNGGEGGQAGDNYGDNESGKQIIGATV